MRPSPHGCDGSSRAFDAKSKRRRTGCGAFRAGIRTCLRIGKWAFGPMLRCKSRMRRESHVRFREGAGVKFPRATRLVVGFEHRHEAEAFLAALRERFARFGLELHPDKTRLIRFGRTAGQDGGPKPPTFNFLGFTHSSGQPRNGYFTVLRQTIQQRWQAKLSEVKAELRRRLLSPVPELGTYLASVVRGHPPYYAVPMTAPPPAP